MNLKYKLKEKVYFLCYCLGIGNFKERTLARYKKYKQYDDEYRFKELYSQIKVLTRQIKALEYKVNNFKYEICDEMNKELVFIPRVMSIDETLDYIICNKVSISRFGERR